MDSSQQLRQTLSGYLKSNYSLEQLRDNDAKEQKRQLTKVFKGEPNIGLPSNADATSLQEEGKQPKTNLEDQSATSLNRRSEVLDQLNKLLDMIKNELPNYPAPHTTALFWDNVLAEQPNEQAREQLINQIGKFINYSTNLDNDTLAQEIDNQIKQVQQGKALTELLSERNNRIDVNNQRNRQQGDGYKGIQLNFQRHSPLPSSSGIGSGQTDFNFTANRNASEQQTANLRYYGNQGASKLRHNPSYQGIGNLGYHTDNQGPTELNFANQANKEDADYTNINFFNRQNNGNVINAGLGQHGSLTYNANTEYFNWFALFYGTRVQNKQVQFSGFLDMAQHAVNNNDTFGVFYDPQDNQLGFIDKSSLHELTQQMNDDQVTQCSFNLLPSKNNKNKERVIQGKDGQQRHYLVPETSEVTYDKQRNQFIANNGEYDWETLSALVMMARLSSDSLRVSDFTLEEANQRMPINAVPSSIQTQINPQEEQCLTPPLITYVLAKSAGMNPIAQLNDPHNADNPSYTDDKQHEECLKQIWEQYYKPAPSSNNAAQLVSADNDDKHMQFDDFKGLADKLVRQMTNDIKACYDAQKDLDPHAQPAAKLNAI